MTDPNLGKETIYHIEDMLDLEPPSYIFKKGDKLIIPNDGISVLYGKPGVGKSFVALDIAIQMAIDGTKVLYICSEGGFDYGRRINAWISHHGLERSNLSSLFMWFIPHQYPNLSQRSSIEEVTKITGSLGIDFCVIDTLNRSIRGTDENSSQEMEIALKNAELLARSILLIHHTNKTGKDYRGSSVLEGNCVAMMELSKTQKGQLRVKSVKNKYGPEFKPYILELIASQDSLVAIDARKLVMPKNPMLIMNAIAGGALRYSALVKTSGVPEGSITKSLNWLIENDYLQKYDGRNANGEYVAWIYGKKGFEWADQEYEAIDAIPF